MSVVGLMPDQGSRVRVPLDTLLAVARDGLVEAHAAGDEKQVKRRLEQIARLEARSEP